MKANEELNEFSEFERTYGEGYGYKGRIDEIRKGFGKLENMVYLDHTASTLYSSDQMRRVQAEYEDAGLLYCNPHSVNPLGIKTSERVDGVREQILALFNAPYREYSVVFTSGSTHSLKMLGECFPWQSERSRFYYHMASHNSVVGMREYACQAGCTFKAVPGAMFKSDAQQDLVDLVKSERKDDTYSDLVCVPGQCNYSGLKVDLSVVNRIKKEFGDRVMVCLDAASLVSTSPLNLSEVKADYVVMSFYKMVGYPTGLGALIVRNGEALDMLKKVYFGGGTVNASLSQERFHIPRGNKVQALEDGTINFLSVVGLSHGLNILADLKMEEIQRHTFSLIQYIHSEMVSLRHSNQQRLCVIYSDNYFKKSSEQGAIINFNLLKPNGEMIGYNEVEKIGSLHNIYFRTGCFCNPGACHSYLNLTFTDIMQQIEEGHVCWDSKDIIKGKATGSVRISLGYMSTFSDAYKFIQFLKKNFLDPESHSTMGNLAQKPAGEPAIITITEAYLYPVKSCGPHVVSKRWEIVESGLKYDREWTIIDNSGNYINQKKLPTLSQIQCEISLESNQLVLRVPEQKPLIIPLDYYPVSAFDKIQVCGDKVDGLLYGDLDIQVIGQDCSDWLYQFTGKKCHLVRKSPSSSRSSKLISQQNNPAGTNNMSFANESPFLLISENSVKDLKSKVEAEHPENRHSFDWISKHSFRSNFVIKTQEPYQEDQWDEFQVGDSLLFKCIGECNRCKMICINQKMGIEEREPLATLATYRRSKGKIIFGQHLQMIKTNEQKDDRIFIDIPSPIKVLSLKDDK